MKTINKTYKVFPFDELNDEAKDKALECLASCNVDYSDWYYDEGYMEDAKEYGLGIRFEQMAFDLDRRNFLAFYERGGKKGIWLEDFPAFSKKAGVKYHICEDCGPSTFYIDTEHFGGGNMQNILRFCCDRSYSEAEQAKLEECFSGFIDSMLDRIKEDYEALTSREAIIDTIEVNEYTFLEDGTLFNE